MDPGGEDDDHGARLAAHAQRLRLLIRHLAGRAVLARVEVDDLLQEVFVRALSTALPAPPDGEDDRALWALLARIARNTVIDAARALRAARRRGKVDRLDRSAWTRVDPLDPAARTAGPATRAAGTEAATALERAFLCLSPEHQRVLGLRHVSGLSAAETGRRMGRSETAVHSLFRRALQAWEAALPPEHRPA